MSIASEISIPSHAADEDIDQLHPPPLLERFYREAPNDILENILLIFSDVDENGQGKGGLNVFRLVNKRLMHGVEACATRITCFKIDGRASLPIAALKRCTGIERIKSYGEIFGSLEGCPAGLKSLSIGDGSSLLSLEPLSACTGLERLEIDYARNISDLSPLATCTRLNKLRITWSFVTEISVLSSTPLLEHVNLIKYTDDPSIKDLFPLCHCKNLKKLDLSLNSELKDLSPLSECKELAELNISDCPLINHLGPLSSLMKLHYINCYKIGPETSLLPLASCTGLKRIFCGKVAKDLEELTRRRPDIQIDTT